MYIDKKTYDFLEKSKLYGNELMLSNIGASIGKVFKIPKLDIPMSLAPNSIILKFFNGIVTDFFEYLFKSFVGQNYLQMLSSGAAMPKFNKTDLRVMLVPIAPTNEQIKIVEKVQILFQSIDLIDNLSSDVSVLSKSIKSKILNLAIQGKLVPQNPEDEPASVLLERIKEEKEELIKQGKIKRDKKESIIFKGDDNSYYEKIGEKIICIDDEIPFDLPKGIEYVRFKEIWELISGRDLERNEYNSEQNGIPYITGASNFNNGNIEISRWTYSPQVISKKGDLLLTCKGTIGEMAVNTFGDAHIARQVMAMRNLYELNIEYLLLCINFYIDKIKKSAKGLIPGISRENILNLILPIPSQQYQKNVVECVKLLLKYINEIEKSLI